MKLGDSFRHAVRVLGFGMGIIHEPPAIRDDPAITAARETERELRAQSLMFVRDLRTDNLARLQRRLSGDV